MNLSRRLSVAILAAFVLLSSAASAQTLPQRLQETPSWEPGQAGNRLSVQPEAPAVGGAPVVKAPLPKHAQMAGGVTFTLKSLEVKGNTVFSEAELKAEYAEYLGKEISLGTLGEIADKITVHYRNAGYILSRAVVPPQHIAAGKAVIQVVEGYISHVTYSGVPGDARVLRGYAENIQADRPLNSTTLERYLLLMQDLPGATARAVLRPAADATGAAELVVTMTDTPIDGSATLDNRGSRYVGPIQAGLTVNANNILGWYDRTQFHGVNTAEYNELHYEQLVHEEQLDSEGTKLALSVAHTASDPAYKLAPFDIESQDNDYTATFTHPFLRSRMSNLFGNLTFEMRDTDTDALDTLLYQDKLHIVRGAGTYDFVDSFAAVNRFGATVSKGFSFDDESITGTHSRAHGQADFTKWEGQASRLQPIGGAFNLYGAATGQYSDDTLLASEEFGLGGPSFGSAYDPSELTGDSGFAVRAELQYNRDGDFALVPSYQLYGFWDFGKVWVRDALAGQKDQPSLASTGLGLRFNILQPLSGNLELAVPLTKLVAANGQDGSSPRGFFSLAYRF